MSERLMFQGKLLEKKQEAERLRIILRGMVSCLREKLDPTEQVEDLEPEAIVKLATEFGLKQIDLQSVLAQIKTIKRELGER